MNRVLWLLAALSLAAPARALSTTVQIPGTDVTFDLPAGFVRMPDDIRKLKYARGTPPQVVYSTPGPSWAVNIAFALSPRPLPGGHVQAFQQQAERTFKAVPGVQWVGSDCRTVAGRQWCSVRFWIPGLDAPIYNDLRSTLVGGKLLLVTANASKARYPQDKAQLKAALDSLR